MNKRKPKEGLKEHITRIRRSGKKGMNMEASSCSEYMGGRPGKGSGWRRWRTQETSAGTTLWGFPPLP